jgi:3alpha(or 20beta)-hydroxysteroid dehydrogenase
MTNENSKSQIAVVTGGASGIGAEICSQLLAIGARVYSLDLLSNSGQAEVEDLYPLQCDVTDERALRESFSLISKQGAITKLFINAGIVPPWSKSADFTRQSWESVLNVNVIGAALTLKYGSAAMKKPGGSIVFTASLNAWKGDSNITSYVASKHALLGIVKSAAIEFGSEGIRVNAVAPGPIATQALKKRLLDRANGDFLAEEEAYKKLSSTTALQRIASVEEVANLALFLASDKASGVTGQMINVDCGVL